MGFVERLQQLISLTGKDQKDIALDLKVYESQLSKWATGGTPPRSKSIAKIVKYFGCNYRWLVSGEGPMMSTENEKNDTSGKVSESNKTISKKIAATIEPGNKKILKDLRKGKSRPEQIKEDSVMEKKQQPSVQDMLEMTKVVLDSNTVYRSALASNVRSFYKAVVNEGEMDIMRGELAAIRKENQEMREGQERIEEMLRSLGAAQIKRDSAA